MHIELAPDKSILIIPLEIRVLEGFNPLFHRFRTLNVDDRRICCFRGA